MWLTNLVSFLFLFLIGFLVKKFKLANLVSGYNTLSREKKEEYDVVKLTKVTGNMLMISSSFLLIPLILDFININFNDVYYIVSWIAFTLYIIIAVINMNMNSDLVKKDK